MRHLAIVALALICWPAAVPAQAAERVYRLGVLGPGDATSWESSPVRTITLAHLAALGFVEGRNLAVEPRYGPRAALPALAREIVRWQPDVIVAVTAVAIGAAAQATGSIPIVMSFSGEDPVARGFVSSLARPGGNVTGLVMFAPELDAKRLHILLEAVPAARRVAFLVMERDAHRDSPKLTAVRPVADRSGVDLSVHPIATPDDYPGAFRAMRLAGAEAVVISSSTEFFRDTEKLVAHALEARLPTVCEWSEMARRGCLLGYGPDLIELRRRTADYVARLLRGAAPGELPIERPTRFEFAINLKTARALAIEAPPGLLLRADEIVE